jgi:enamine deaminase RidA (YjgF/YER057c/UK114 family)
MAPETATTLIDARLDALGWVLPPPPRVPPGLSIPFAWARVHGDRVFLSGHGPLDDAGVPRGPFGRVGAEVSLAQAQAAARGAMLALLASLKHAIGGLDRVAAWLSVSGMVNVGEGFRQTTDVINPASELLLRLFGDEVGQHARTAVGMAQLPLNLPVVIAAEVALEACSPDGARPR